MAKYDISSWRGSNNGIVPDNVDNIVQISCSHNMKYVATIYKYVYENSSAEQQDGRDLKESAYGGLIETKKLVKVSEVMRNQIEDPRPKLWAFRMMSTLYLKQIIFIIILKYSNAKGERKELIFPNPYNLVNQLAFTKSGDLVVALTEPSHHIYIFNLEHNEWIVATKFELSYFCDAFITIEEKLILFDDQTFQLTKWDISTLTVQTNCMIDWCYKVWHVEVNQGGELLAVYAVYLQEGIPKSFKLYIYSLKSGINMAICNWECLLIRSRNPFNDELYIELMDPFTLKNPVSAKKLLESNEQIRDPFIIKPDKKSDNIISVINDNLDIYELLELFQTDWITYLRKELGDYNRIFVLSDTEYIKKVIYDELDEGGDFTDPEISPEINGKPTFTGKFLKWRLYYKYPNTSGYVIEIEAQALDQISGDWRPVEGGVSRRTVTPNFQPPEHTRQLKLMRYLSQTTFVVPLTDPELILDSNIASLSSTKHLSYFETYNQLSTKGPLIDTFVAKKINNRSKLIGGSKSKIEDTQQSADSEPTIILLFPFSNFVNYPKTYSTWEELKNPSTSCFINFDYLSFYKTWNVVALSNNISWSYQFFFLNIAVVLGFWHLFFEIRQLYYSPQKYFSNLPATSTFWLMNGTVSIWAITFSTLLLELKFILFFRFIQFFGSSSTNMFEQLVSATLASFYMIIKGDLTPISLWISNDNTIELSVEISDNIYEIKQLTESLEQKSEKQIAEIKNLITNLTNRLAEKGM
ncbi:hypothetical protein C2G38_2157285 [Gigaspora rosea]|uniref:Uncharacterized protein n=1 Tax=Gigaspora rosea TaxID=44941 RepID=A0A397W1Q4_9GLOM|nr:hypothetical protein C2G38_2157285 [Gigaspora rosea]